MKPGRRLSILGIGSTLAYLLVAWSAGAPGFPLDDAWIHQTYARNLGLYGQWAFILGQPSAGSTSPLWTVLIAAGYFLRLDYALWTDGLNALLLGGLAWTAYKMTGYWWLGAWVAAEWHLAWAAASGMETLLFSLLVLAAWWLVLERDLEWRRCALCGVVIGLAVWTRPDGLTLLPFCALSIWYTGDGALTDSGRLRRLAWLLGGAAMLLIPYFGFNYALSGRLWPNTFFAKQAEYAILQQLPLWQRLADVYSAPFLGAVALLLPGLVLGARRWPLPLAWTGAFLLAYALRLPETYQHARYLIPVIPVLVVTGGSGMAGWLELRSAVTWRRVASRTWALAAVTATLAFWALGANALAMDNRVINDEMVATARWVAANVPAGSLVAAHDIGALGYYADVRLLDLAGLVSPEVIPSLGDDARLWRFVQQGGARYVITYPGWCPAFTQETGLKPVYQTGPLCGPDNKNLHMTVYEIVR